jgi:tRNA 2-thiocytidine biosynthesis protein TtcA
VSFTGLVRRAVEEFGLIQAGDKILLGASGGKDSTALAYALSGIRHAYGGSFTITAVHVKTDLGVNAPVPQLRSMLEGWGIELVEIEVGVRERLKPGRTMNCYWCSTQRRTELLAWAMEHGYNKMALGHHLDDILETLFMNMMQKGEMSTMPVKLAYDKYPLTIIRPLALVEEKQIIEWIKQEDLGAATCTCPFGANSRRKDVRNRIAVLTDGFPGAKLRMFRSLGNQKPTYLPGSTLD